MAAKHNPRLHELKTEFSIDHLYAIYYSELAKDHLFMGEKHDFWEMMYVARGLVITTIEERKFILKAKDAILISPQKFHTLSCDGKNSSDIINISFTSNFDGFHGIADTILKSSQITRQLLINIIGELGVKDTYTYKVNLFLNNHEPQLMYHHAIKVYIELMLIHFLRENATDEKDISIGIKAELTEDDTIFDMMVQYLESNINRNIDLEMLCQEFLLSKAKVRQIFLKSSGVNFKKYYIHIKIEKAKILLRESNYSITEISGFLGYETIHYFSEIFHTMVGMSPKAYRSSLFVH